MARAISREQAWELLTEWVSSESLRRHCLAVETGMLAYARREQINHGRAKFGDEAGVASVAFRIPCLRVCHFGVPRRTAAAYQPFLFSAFGNSAFSSQNRWNVSGSSSFRSHLAGGSPSHTWERCRAAEKAKKATGLLWLSAQLNHRNPIVPQLLR